MIHSFDALTAEYVGLLATCILTSPAESKEAAIRLLRDLEAYRAVEATTGVPAVWLMAVNERESGGRLDRYLGNGQRLDQVTTMVPKGRGPFEDWPSGAIDSLKLDHIDTVTDWSWPRFCFQCELWNGFGYRDYHHIHSPYLWGATNIQQRGKYTADGRFDPDEMDDQLGTIAIARSIVALNPELDLK